MSQAEPQELPQEPQVDPSKLVKSITAIDDLTHDPNNANAGTDRGRGVLRKSLDVVGAGRSIVADRNGVVPVGNKTLEAWREKGGAIRVVQSDGTELIVVQRTDLDLLSDDDERARLLAFFDNRVGELNLQWDMDVVYAFARGEGEHDPDVVEALWTPDELAEIAFLIEGGVPDFPPVEDLTGSPQEPYRSKAEIKVTLSNFDARGAAVEAIAGLLALHPEWGGTVA